MPYCTHCSNPQARLRRGNLCKKCSELGISGEISDGNNTMISHDNIQAPADCNSINSYYDTAVQNNQVLGACDESQQSDNGVANDPSIQLELNKSITEFTAADLLKLFKSNHPLEKKMDAFNQRVEGLGCKVKCLENELHGQNRKNEILTGIVVDMQRTLNSIDQKERSTNVVIMGLPEEELKLQNGITLVSDRDKVNNIFSEIGVGEEIKIVNENKVTRIGRKIENMSRILKVKLPDAKYKETVLANSSKLKNIDAPFNKVFIKKDMHPVYLNENKRLWKKMAELKKKDGYGHETGRVKIDNGELKVDGRTVDKNTFFY